MNGKQAFAWASLVFAYTIGGTAHAVQPDEKLADAALEARARTLSAELRCMVCQNQSIDDSDAELARDLRILVRERVTAGDDRDHVSARAMHCCGEGHFCFWWADGCLHT